MADPARRPAIFPSSDRASLASSVLRPRRELSEAQRAVLERHRFKPGKSGNPSGRLKGLRSVAALVDRALHRLDPATGITRLEQLVEAFADACVRCEPWALKMLFDRIWPVSAEAFDAGARIEVTEAGHAELDAKIERALAKMDGFMTCPQIQSTGSRSTGRSHGT